MDNLQAIAEWFLENMDFLDSLLFEAIHLSRRLSHYEYDDKKAYGLDATLNIEFLSPLEGRNRGVIETVHLVFEIARHNPITLIYDTHKWIVEGEWKSKDEVESIELLRFIDCLHMEGSSYDDLEAIRTVIHHRLATLAKGEKITNYGVLNVGADELCNVIKKLRSEIIAMRKGE